MKFALAAVGMLSCLTAVASPVEFDTPDAHVIVIRPIDSWSGDTTLQERTLESIRARRCSYKFTDDEGRLLQGSPMALRRMDDHPVTKGVEAALAPLNESLVSNDRYYFVLAEPVSVEPEKFDTMIKAEKAYYRGMVIKQGDPATLPDRVHGNKFLGGVVSFAATFIAMDKLGMAAGSAATVGSGLDGDIYRFAAQTGNALAPLNLPDFDASPYKQIDVRRVASLQNNFFGQVIIAYKSEKTTEAEQAALIRAIVSLTGADTTVDDVQKARSVDLAARKEIW
ncbi:MAG TPA: hypothetical protein VK832_02455, partial [Burkholderiaceae bacterium]|nr:hypothetical protein [Burkholderiaceae bacterium]